MRDTRSTRLALSVGLAAAISAILGEMFLRPYISGKLR